VPDEIRQVEHERLDEQDCRNPLVVSHVDVLAIALHDLLFRRDPLIVGQVVRVADPTVAGQTINGSRRGSSLFIYLCLISALAYCEIYTCKTSSSVTAKSGTSQDAEVYH